MLSIRHGEALWATFPAPLEACVVYIGTVLALRLAQWRPHIGPTRGSGTWAHSASKACRMVARGRVAQGPGHVSVENAAFWQRRLVAQSPRVPNRSAPSQLPLLQKVGQVQRPRWRKGKTASASFHKASTTVAFLSQCNRHMANNGTMRTLINRKSTRCRPRT